VSNETTKTQAQKAARFRELHSGEPFVMPNPWDAGSARVLEALGFEALATTSSGFAYTLGRADGEVTLGEVAEHVRRIVAVTSVPLSVDLENGFGHEPADAARAIRYAGEAGAVGGSIEDFDGSERIYEKRHAVERVAAAVEAARAFEFSFTLTARAENLIRGVDDLDDTIDRLQGYERAGADVLFAPGLRTVDQIRTVCEAVSAPVNVLASPTLSVKEIADAGARRISVGGRLAFVSLAAMVDVAGSIRDGGDLSGLEVRLPLDEWLG
jgi:2-methylisocitrate lyase-like PEP mutase family enzyme